MDSAYQVIDYARFRRYVIHHAQLERLHTGMRWAEGPVWFADGGFLLWSDIPNDRVLRWVDGQVSTFRAPSRNANGHTRDREGRLIACESGSRRVTRLEPDGRETVIAERHEGKRLNSPNDVVVAEDGAIWFTDPDYGILSDYTGDRAESEIGRNNVFRVDAGSGAMTVAADDVDKPNGLAFSPDGRVLYVADSGASHDPGGPHEIVAFDVDGGRLRNRRVFAVIAPGIPDGLRVDVDGNVWTSAADGVHCLAPDGALIGKILVPETVANLTFGGTKRNRMFITAGCSLYAIFVGTRGAQVP